MRLLGRAQVHAQRVDGLENSQFALGSLFGKLLFVDDDVKAGARLPDGLLKMISEAKEVTGEQKYKPTFQFVVRTVPLLLCNNVPSLADVSPGMMRRLMVIPFARRFTDADRDRDLFEQIWGTELPGILNAPLKLLFCNQLRRAPDRAYIRYVLQNALPGAIPFQAAMAIPAWGHSTASASPMPKGEIRPRAYAGYYNDIRTHRSLDKDAPVSRPVQRTGIIRSLAILGGLHHHYVRV
jgi:hypothetical protein